LGEVGVLSQKDLSTETAMHLFLQGLRQGLAKGPRIFIAPLVALARCTSRALRAARSQRRKP